MTSALAGAPHLPSKAANNAGVAADAELDRGAYLVNAVMACDSCHTPRREDGRLDLARRFSGGSEVWDTPNFTVHGSNITPDSDTGIGAWSEDDLKRLLTQGVRPNGVRVAPQMPYGLYRLLTPRDLDAVVRYVRSVAPLRNEMPAPVYKTEAYAGPLLAAKHDSAKPAKAEGKEDPASRGAYLGSLAYCMACHSRRPDGVVDTRNWWGKGGFVMKGGFGTVSVSNITSSKSKGIGALSDAQLRRALTDGVGHDGRVFKLPMARQAFYSRMTERDIDALIAWLRAIPPSE
ncbi:c-type cytochrome [Sphingomonas sp. MMS12-HWE2-04]|uniref:c-type cytochrome n=1 Tax=Sphingomonas sp. MMS12-HWE2-04 TaxID=3234199 RepID=UPI0038516E16